VRNIKDLQGYARRATDGSFGKLEASHFNDEAGERAMIRLKRAYHAMSRTDGTRFLVERLWPRGVSKATLQRDTWLKEAGPSTALRKRFSHDPGKWREFRRRYFRELDSRPEAWGPIVSAARRGIVTLVYSSHDREHNNAVALRQYVQAKSRRLPRSTPRT
jgi:uncharacterized protein YeaO (DUF488 family)